MKKLFTKLNARFSRFAPPLFIEGQDLYTSDTVKNHPLGTYAFGNHGKVFRYAYMGGVVGVNGTLLQAAAEDTQFENMAVLASAIVPVQNGPQTVNVTNGTTTVVPADFIGGSVSVYTTPDLGSEYDITSITGTLTSGGALTVGLDHPLAVAWTTATKVNMKKSPWSNVIIYPTTQTDMPVGVVVYPIPLNTYGWVQTHGICTVLCDNSTFAVGSGVSPSLVTAGAIGVNVAGTTHCEVGIVRQAAASTHNISVFLQID